jgi:hypothetical protein
VKKAKQTTSATTSSGSGDAFDQPNASNQPATGHFSEDSPATTPSEANAPDLSTRAESEPETQVVDQSPDFSETITSWSILLQVKEIARKPQWERKPTQLNPCLRVWSTQRTNRLADNQRQY